MIAPKEGNLILPYYQRPVSTESLESSLTTNSASQVSESSVQLRESIEDLRGQITALQSTIVDLQNAVAQVSPGRSRDVTPPVLKQVLFYTTKFLLGGGTTSNFEILEWYDLMLFSAVAIVLATVWCATFNGYIEPRDDINLGIATFGVLLIGGFLVRAKYLIRWFRRERPAVTL